MVDNTHLKHDNTKQRTNSWNRTQKWLKMAKTREKKCVKSRKLLESAEESKVSFASKSENSFLSR